MLGFFASNLGFGSPPPPPPLGGPPPPPGGPPPPPGGSLLPPGGLVPPPPVTFEVLTAVCTAGVVGPAVGAVVVFVFRAGGTLTLGSCGGS